MGYSVAGLWQGTTMNGMTAFLTHAGMQKLNPNYKQQQIGIQKAIGFTTFHLMNQVTLGFLPPVAVQYSPLYTSFLC